MYLIYFITGFVPFRFVIDDTFLIGVVKQSYLRAELCEVVSVSNDRDVVVENGMQFLRHKCVLHFRVLGFEEW